MIELFKLHWHAVLLEEAGGQPDANFVNRYQMHKLSTYFMAEVLGPLRQIMNKMWMRILMHALIPAMTGISSRGLALSLSCSYLCTSSLGVQCSYHT